MNKRSLLEGDGNGILEQEWIASCCMWDYNACHTATEPLTFPGDGSQSGARILRREYGWRLHKVFGWCCPPCYHALRTGNKAPAEELE